MKRLSALLKGGSILPLFVFLPSMCPGQPPHVPASGEAIEAAVQDAEADLAKAERRDHG